MSETFSSICISNVTGLPRSALWWAYQNVGESVVLYADGGETVVSGKVAVYNRHPVIECQGRIPGMTVARVRIHESDVLYQRNNGLYEARRGSWPDVVDLP